VCIENLLKTLKMFGLPVNVGKIDHNYGRTTKNPRDFIKSFNTPSDKLLSSTMVPSQDIELSELLSIKTLSPMISETSFVDHSDADSGLGDFDLVSKDQDLVTINCGIGDCGRASDSLRIESTTGASVESDGVTFGQVGSDLFITTPKEIIREEIVSDNPSEIGNTVFVASTIETISEEVVMTSSEIDLGFENLNDVEPKLETDYVSSYNPVSVKIDSDSELEIATMKTISVEIGPHGEIHHVVDDKNNSSKIKFCAKTDSTGAPSSAVIMINVGGDDSSGNETVSRDQRHVTYTNDMSSLVPPQTDEPIWLSPVAEIGPNNSSDNRSSLAGAISKLFLFCPPFKFVPYILNI
jgi:hypothetical protein